MKPATARSNGKIQVDPRSVNSLPAILFALIAFVATFTVARLLRHAHKKRQSRRRAEEELKGQSRQVRRARSRKGR